ACGVPWITFRCALPWIVAAHAEAAPKPASIAPSASSLRTPLTGRIVSGEVAAQAARALEQVLRQHFHVAEHGHEARIAVPSRDDVQVHVILDTGAGDAPEVPAEVEAVRRVLGPERLDRPRSEVVD